MRFIVRSNNLTFKHCGIRSNDGSLKNKQLIIPETFTFKQKEKLERIILFDFLTIK